MTDDLFVEDGVLIVESGSLALTNRLPGYPAPRLSGCPRADVPVPRRRHQGCPHGIRGTVITL
jgi:hypothetical protein